MTLAVIERVYKLFISIAESETVELYGLAVEAIRSLLFSAQEDIGPFLSPSFERLQAAARTSDDTGTLQS
jgi:hypothetical protein